MAKFEKLIRGADLIERLIGECPRLIEQKKNMLSRVYYLFKERHMGLIDPKTICLIYVPNRVELLGKHTDYQGGETLLLTGPRNFFAISAISSDGVSELFNADERLGRTVLKFGKQGPEVLCKGEGSHYAVTVSKRLCNNLNQAGLPQLKNVRSVFIGDIPIGGGTSGSSAKLITDFYIFCTSNGLIDNERFISLVLENGKKAGLKLDQQFADNFSLALSMYLAHFENGLDFGNLRGDRGVGTFGGSEDHTAVLLGEKAKLLYAEYCPTEIIDKLDAPEDYKVVAAYSGRAAEKTKEAMAKYNRLSKDARSCVEQLNRINGTECRYLRDFFNGASSGEKAEKAYEQLSATGKDLAERAYQFYKESAIIKKAAECIKRKDIDGFGRLINESHELSRTYLKNIVPEVDFLARSANELGACGATGFGAGFGGSSYAVVHRNKADDFIKEWQEKYAKEFPRYRDKAQFDFYPASSGAYWEALHD